MPDLDLDAIKARHPEGEHECPNCHEYLCDGQFYVRKEFGCEVAPLLAEIERLRAAQSDRYGNDDCVPVSAATLREWARLIDDEISLDWVATRLREAAEDG